MQGKSNGYEPSAINFHLQETSPREPRGLDHAHHRLPASMHMDVLDRDLLLTLAAMPVKRVDQSRVGATDWMTTSGIIEAADEIAKKRAASDNALRFDFVFIVRTLTHYIFTNFVPPFEPTTLP
jgi:hypothetical protein